MEEKEFFKKIGERITFIRKRKKMTQIQLAYKCDFERSNMRRIEAGRTNPTASTLLKIAKALEVEPQELFRFKLLNK